MITISVCSMRTAIFIVMMPPQNARRDFCGLLRSARERKGDVACPLLLGTRVSLVVQNAAATRSDDDVLSPVDLVGRRRGITCNRQRGFPEQLAGLLIERPELPIVIRRADENQPARNNHRAAVVLTA